MRQARCAVALAVLIALGACDEASRAPSSPAPDETPSATPSVSIIRPDVVSTLAVELPPEPFSAVIGFPNGGTKLDEAAQAELAKVIASEQLAKDWPVTLRGHTDSAGGDAANLALSRKRAEAVANYLIDHDVSEERIKVIALGEQNPTANNAHPDGSPDEEGRAQNRRVVVDIEDPAEGAPSE